MAGGRICLTAKVRDEGPYLVEWVAYHRSLGIDDIVIVSNDLTDGSDALLRALADGGWVHWRDISGEPLVRSSIGIRAYKHLWQHPVVQASEWLVDLDLDEFLVLHQEDSVQAFVEARADADLVLLNWRNFGSDGRCRRALNSLVLDSFNQAVQARFVKANEVKSVFRTVSVKGLSAHIPHMRPGAVRVRHADGQFLGGSRAEDVRGRWYHTGDGYVDYRVAQVNHYAVRTAAEYVLRGKRGDSAVSQAGMNPRYGFDYFLRRNQNLEGDTSGRLAAVKMRRWVTRVLEDSAIRLAHRDCLALSEQRLAEVTRQSREWALLCGYLSGFSPARMRRQVNAAYAAGCTGAFWDEAGYSCAGLFEKTLVQHRKGGSWRSALGRARRDLSRWKAGR